MLGVSVCFFVLNFAFFGNKSIENRFIWENLKVYEFFLNICRATMVKTAKQGDTSRNKNKVNLTADRAKSGHTKKAQNPKKIMASSEKTIPHIIPKNTNPFYGEKPNTKTAHRVLSKHDLHLKDLFSKINQEKDKLQLLTSKTQPNSKSKSKSPPLIPSSLPKKSIFNSYNTQTHHTPPPPPPPYPKNRRKNTKHISRAS
jgi:hypothetical protein